MEPRCIEWQTGFNDYLWFRTKAPNWIKTNEQKQSWSKGQEDAKSACKPL